MQNTVPRKTSSGARTASQKLALKLSTPTSTPFILRTENLERHQALSPLNIDLVRKEIPVTSRRAYFDNAGTGPPSINVLNAIDDNTSIVSVDYVSWTNGCREKIREIAKIAHEHNAFVIADSFHGLGVFPINAKQDGVDALACGMYKWMQGPHGAAYLYTHHDRLSELDPNYIGWHGVEDSVVRRMSKQEDLFGKPFNIDIAEPALDATRFEGGSWGVVSIVGAKAEQVFLLGHSSDY